MQFTFFIHRILTKDNHSTSQGARTQCISYFAMDWGSRNQVRNIFPVLWPAELPRFFIGNFYHRLTSPENYSTKQQILLHIPLFPWKPPDLNEGGTWFLTRIANLREACTSCPDPSGAFDDGISRLNRHSMNNDSIGPNHQ